MGGNKQEMQQKRETDSNNIDMTRGKQSKKQTGNNTAYSRAM